MKSWGLAAYACAFMALVNFAFAVALVLGFWWEEEYPAWAWMIFVIAGFVWASDARRQARGYREHLAFMDEIRELEERRGPMV